MQECGTAGSNHKSEERTYTQYILYIHTHSLCLLLVKYPRVLRW